MNGVVSVLRQTLCEAGLDVVHPCRLGWYRAPAAFQGRLKVRFADLIAPSNTTEAKTASEADAETNTDADVVADPDVADGEGEYDQHCCLLVGNSRAFWEPFVRDLADTASDEGTGDIPSDPVDMYTSRVLQAALRQVDGGAAADHADVFYPHEMQPGRRIAFQHLAAQVGLAYHHRPSCLCIHPELGAWFAMRALVVFRHDWLQQRALEDVQGGDDDQRGSAAAAIDAVFGGVHGPDAAQMELLQGLHPSAEAEARVAQALDEALAWEGTDEEFALALPWVRLRDALQPDHPHRYGALQIAYHYMHSRSKERARAVLLACVEEMREG